MNANSEANANANAGAAAYVTANADAVKKIRHTVAKIEKKLLLNVARKGLGKDSEDEEEEEIIE